MSGSGADNLDKATDLAMLQNETSIAEVRHRARPEQEIGTDGRWPKTHCDDCDAHIPVARLRLGKIRCIYCQEALERRRAGR